MHIADKILKEVAEGKIVDIFAEPEKTKVFLQLKELELITVKEVRVEITEEGKKALETGIRQYFAQKRAARSESQVRTSEPARNEPLLDIPVAAVAVPAAVVLFILLMLLVMINISGQ